MKNLLHILKYFLISLIIFLISYSIAIFIPITKTAKAIDNIFMLIFPLIIFYLMIKNYKKDNLTYFEKAGIMFLYVIFLSALIIIMGIWNPTNMTMNATEKRLGVIRISLTYGFLLLTLGLILAKFIKPKK